jgi:hypothetical protein
MTGKNIVFIAPEFFTFHKQIQKRLEDLGNKVYFIPDRPSQNAIVKILIRKFRFLLTPYLNTFFEKRSSEIPSGDIDEIFVIRGEGLTAKALLKLKARFPKARFQLYLWDSVRRSPGCEDLIPLFDRTWTYDLCDAKAYPNLKFTPNFYTLPETRTFHRAPVKDFTWDLAFFGTAHADRLKVISRLAKALPSEVRFYKFFYFQSLILYNFRKFFDPAFSLFKKEELSLKPKFGKDWDDIVSRTSTILDVHHPDQGGLTIRSIESLALGYKLVTTDKSIEEYEFFNPQQILVIDRNNPKIDPEFLRKANAFPVHAKVAELELTSWIDKIFSRSTDLSSPKR